MMHKNRANIYILTFCTTIFLCLLLLVLAAHLPQEKIDQNVAYSAEIMVEEGVYPATLDRTYAGRLDNWTDALILMESKAMNSKNLETVLSNPLFSYGGEHPVINLYEYVQDADPAPAGGYVRYWMGFRSIMRLLLCFFNYYQIKRYVAFALFALFALLICQIGEKVNYKVALAFAFSIILVRPHVVCNCLQFSCCFLIAFAAMICVPWMLKKSKYERLFFMVTGILTMYFDFYTTPIVTFGLPAIYLYLLRTVNGNPMKTKEVAADAMMWFAGYLCAWLTKLILTTLLTPYDAISNGINSARGWLGTGNTGINGIIGSIINAFKGVAMAILADKEGLFAIVAVVVIVCVVGIVFFKKGKYTIEGIGKHPALIVIAFIPIIWFAVASKPTAGHFWFQYRSVCVCYWVALTYLSLIVKKPCKNGK